jgi:hypothetical protein
MRRFAIIILVLWTACTGVAAQNEVDKMVNRLSTIGTAVYTSAVERDPKTHKIMKVVNELKITGPSVTKLINTFNDAASKQKNSYTKKEDNSITKIFTQNYPTSSRIYMMKYLDNSFFPDTRITIIIKRK